MLWKLSVNITLHEDTRRFHVIKFILDWIFLPTSSIRYHVSNSKVKSMNFLLSELAKNMSLASNFKFEFNSVDVSAKRIGGSSLITRKKNNKFSTNFYRIDDTMEFIFIIDCVNCLVLALDSMSFQWISAVVSLVVCWSHIKKNMSHPASIHKEWSNFYFLRFA